MMFVIITISSASYVRYQYLFSQVVMFGNSIIEWWAEPLPIVTKGGNHTKRTMSKGWGDAYQTLPESWVPFARGAKTIGDFGMVYQRLPILRSGSRPIVAGLYQSLPPHRRHNTHLIRVCVMLGYNGLWLISMAYWWGNDRHLYDVGVLWVRLAIIVYELLCLAYGMEVERVLA